MLGSYEKLAVGEMDLNCDEETLASLQSSSRKRSCASFPSFWPLLRFVALGACAVGWFAALAITWTASKTLIKSPQPGFLPGGNLSVPGYGMVYRQSYCNGWADPQGARERGCILDSLQGGWIHELCTNPELLEEWKAMPDFGWYWDEERTQRISQEQVYAGEVQ
jgi:hypothetical protein